MNLGFRKTNRGLDGATAPRWGTGLRPVSLLEAALILTLGVRLALAQDPIAAESQPASQPATQPESQPADAPDSQPASAAASRTASKHAGTSTASSSTQAADEEKDRYLAVINGVVYTVTGPTLPGATVLSKNGRIVAIGAGVHLPDECDVIDAAGMNVYPGFVAAGAGGIHGGRPIEHSTDVYGLNMTIALAGGITSAISGNDVAKLTLGSTQDMLVRRDAFFSLRYGSRRPLERAEVRADLEKVRGYLRDLKRYEIDKSNDPDAEAPDKDFLKGKYEDYRKLLAGETTAVVQADRANDILTAVELADDFGFRLVVRGAMEAWTVAGRLARANVGVVITPRTITDPDERFNRPTGSTVESVRILRDHGVTVAVTSPVQSITTFGLGGRDLLHLNMEAAFAVRGGLSNEEALRTITIDAAKVLGVDDRVGSLEVGKDADLIVTAGPALHYTTQVHYAVVNGRRAYEKSKETLFAHIRPKGEASETTFDDQWPRRLEWPEQVVEPASQPAAAKDKKNHGDTETRRRRDRAK
ncbi:imidazolonepropionase [Phycisphaerae bacterium RAS1]|nr:imidazolonepropionase [Phycisphaerae bacterium RAS1]